MDRYNSNRGGGWNNQRGGCLEESKIVVFLGKHVSFTYLREQLSLIHLFLNSGSVEYTFETSFRLFRNYCYYHFSFPNINKRGEGLE